MGKKNSIKPEDPKNQLGIGFPIPDLNAISNSNAPSRITRNIKKDRVGNLLIAAYEGIYRFDGQSFTDITKAIGLDSCYTFDVLEDMNGNSLILELLQYWLRQVRN